MLQPGLGCCHRNHVKTVLPNVASMPKPCLGMKYCCHFNSQNSRTKLRSARNAHPDSKPGHAESVVLYSPNECRIVFCSRSDEDSVWALPQTIMLACR